MKINSDNIPIEYSQEDLLRQLEELKQQIEEQQLATQNDFQAEQEIEEFVIEQLRERGHTVLNQVPVGKCRDRVDIICDSFIVECKRKVKSSRETYQVLGQTTWYHSHYPTLERVVAAQEVSNNAKYRLAQLGISVWHLGSEESWQQNTLDIRPAALAQSVYWYSQAHESCFFQRQKRGQFVFLTSNQHGWNVGYDTAYIHPTIDYSDRIHRNVDWYRGDPNVPIVSEQGKDWFLRYAAKYSLDHINGRSIAEASKEQNRARLGTKCYACTDLKPAVELANLLVEELPQYITSKSGLSYQL